MGRKPIHFIISEQEREEVVTMQRSLNLKKRYVDRAKIIILSLEGNTLDQIVDQIQLSRRAVNKWRQRFKSSGIAGLRDAPRSGKRIEITQEITS